MRKMLVGGLWASLAVLLLGGCVPEQSSAQMPRGLANTGFEHVAGGRPQGWHIDPGVEAKGTIAAVAGPGGSRVLQLRPNGSNSGEKLLGVGQLFNAEALRGREVEVRARLAGRDGANAIVGVHALGKGGDLGFVQLRQGDSQGALVAKAQTLTIAQDAENIVVYAIVEGKRGEALFDDITVTPRGASPAAARPETAGAATIQVDVRNPVRTIPRDLYGTNVEWIFDGQGLWASAGKRLDPDAIRLTRELGVPLLRFPGGVFSDFYHWRDGLGPQGERPTTRHYPGGPESRHSFGLPELNRFARQVGADLLLTVNVGTGTPQEAADWVRHMQGKDQAEVRYWEIGNELYMEGDLSGAHMGPKAYAQRFLEFARAMRQVDPAIKLGGIGGLNYGRYRFIADDRWSEILLQKAAPEMDFLAIHNAYAPVVIGASESVDPRAVYYSMLAAPTLIEQNLREVSELLARHESPSRPIAIAITEWGPFFHILPENPWVDHIKTMGSALFVASTLNTFLRSPRVEIATFFKLTDHGFMGWIGQRDGRFAATAPYLVFQLYREALGETLVQTRAVGPTFNGGGIGVVDPVRDVPYLDAVATFDDGVLSLVVTNKSDTRPMVTTLDVQGISGYQRARYKTISSDSLDAHTGTELPRIPGLRWARQVNLAQFDKGAPGQIRVESGELERGEGPPTFRFPPLSVTHLRFEGVRR